MVSRLAEFRNLVGSTLVTVHDLEQFLIEHGLAVLLDDVDPNLLACLRIDAPVPLEGHVQVHRRCQALHHVISHVAGSALHPDVRKRHLLRLGKPHLRHVDGLLLDLPNLGVVELARGLAQLARIGPEGAHRVLVALNGIEQLAPLEAREVLPAGLHHLLDVLQLQLALNAPQAIFDVTLDYLA